MTRFDNRQPCILFLSCIGVGPKYFLQLSDDFRARYRIVPFVYNTTNTLPDMYPLIEKELERSPLLIYHEPDWVPFLRIILGKSGGVGGMYDQFIENLPPHVRKISYPLPMFDPFWPFHSGEPRNADGKTRPLNRYGSVPGYPRGDSYVLRLLEEGIPPEEVISRYRDLDIAKEVDLDRLLQRTIARLEAQERSGPVKVADFIASTFRSKKLFQTINHASNRMLLYMSNKILELLDCKPVPESVLDSIMETVERPHPVHPSIARHFGVTHIDETTRYMVDEIYNLTFAEFVPDYVHYAEGTIGDYRIGLVNNPMVPSR